MHSVLRVIIISFSFMFLASCKLTIPYADNTFGQQYFVSTVALVELHKLRNGEYPETLEKLQFLGDWDSMSISAVKYKRTKLGYDLFITRGWLGTPNLSFPEAFRSGLGIRKSNITWVKSKVSK